MIRILYIVNQNKGLGSIRRQVDIMKDNLNKTPGFYSDIFSTKGTVFLRIRLFFSLFSIGKKYDIFHIHGCSYWGFIPIVFGVTAGKVLKKKILITYHGGDALRFFSKRPHFTRFFLERADHLIVLSGYLKSIFEKLGYEVRVIPNIIEDGKTGFVPRRILKTSFISTRSLEPFYNIKLVLDAFKKIQHKNKDASLIILGKGSIEEQLLDLVEKESINNISFPGQVPNDEIFHYLGKSDILINAPIADNMPLSLLEAFSSGVLVISSNVGGIPYMIDHKKNGLLFESGNIIDLTEKIEFALENQELSKQMVLNAFNYLERYRWEAVKTDILELYSC